MDLLSWLNFVYNMSLSLYVGEMRLYDLCRHIRLQKSYWTNQKFATWYYIVKTWESCLHWTDLLFETNLINSRNYKIDRCCNLEEDCNFNVKVKTLYVEVSSLGFLSKNIKELKKLCRKNADTNLKRILQKIYEVAIRSTYLIFTKRNSEWTNPDNFKFY